MMSRDPVLSWGILSTAAILDRLMPAFRAARSADPQAIASRSFDKARDAAAKNGIPVAYGSYEELLADPKIDAVYIPLPNHLHIEWAKKAADAGKHILCEKPLALNAAEATELVQYCRNASVRLMDGFMWPHHPRTYKIRETLEDGTIGRVTKVNAAFTFMLEGLPKENIRMKPECGGGGLLDVGSYCVYAIRWWMREEPVEVWAKAEYHNGVDVAMSGVLTFDDGRMASFDCGFKHPLRTWVEIVGETGAIRVPNMWIPNDQAAFEIIRQSGSFDHEIERVVTPNEDQMVHMLDDFAAAVSGNREPNPSPSEAIKTAKVCDALTESARKGASIKL